MRGRKSALPEAESVGDSSELVKVIAFTKEEGWFVFTEYELPKAALEKHGKALFKTNPDVISSFFKQLQDKVCAIYGI